VAQKTGKPRPGNRPVATGSPAETLNTVAVCNRIEIVRLPDWPYRHPLALPTVIRTVIVVPPNGAALGRESGTGAP